jgi:hypothetical protein
VVEVDMSTSSAGGSGGGGGEDTGVWLWCIWLGDWGGEAKGAEVGDWGCWLKSSGGGGSTRLMAPCWIAKYLSKKQKSYTSEGKKSVKEGKYKTKIEVRGGTGRGAVNSVQEEATA